MSTQSDIKLIALCLWREARGEGSEGMLAVACVIRNRVKAKWGDWMKVIMGKNQFTSMSVKSDPQIDLQPKAGDKLYAKALAIAEGVYDDEIDDITKGALYYGNLKAIDKGGWFERNIVNKPAEHPETVSIGNHSFFL
jgi:N-acetylmuramoyl-L-alanine amidase